MKLFRVTTERDGETTKVPGRSTTEINRADRWFMALDFQSLLLGIQDIRDDPEQTIVAIKEEIPGGITIIKDEP